MQAISIHPWEEAGLGKAPFRLVKEVYQNIQYGQRVIGHVGGCEVTTKPGASCDVCGTYIVNIFQIESSDGNRFIVGSDCVLKLDKYDYRLVNDVKAMLKTKKKGEGFGEMQGSLRET